MFTQNRANPFNVYGEFIFNTNTDIEPLKYNLQSMATPSITLNSTEINSRGTKGTIPGDTIIKDESVPLRFILDDTLQVYFNLIDIQKSNMGYSEDTFIILVQDNFNNTIARAEYTKAWISSISGIQYDITDTATTMFIEVQLNFLDFNIIPLSNS